MKTAFVEIAARCVVTVAVAVTAAIDAFGLDAGVARVGGVPRFTVDGRPISATSVMPSPAGKPGAAASILKSFHSAGAVLASDVWTMHDKRYNPRQWWLGEGEYDFEQFDAIAHGLTDAMQDGMIFPRIKIDPPAKWCEAHPDEMMSEISPWPDSIAWRDLYRRMLKDVVEHVEQSDYADKVIGYHIGAFNCGEWLVISAKPKVKALLNPVPCDIRDPLPPVDAIAGRRSVVAHIAESTADMLIDAASCLKELTQGRKLVGAFFGYPSMAHEKLSRVLRSGVVDFIAAPPHYGESREPGNAGRSQTYYQASYRLHGIVYFEETDYRTFLSDPAFAPYPATRRRNLESSISMIRRSIGKSLAGGWENWYFLLGGNETFSDPCMMDSIRIGAEEARKTLETARWKPADVAVFTAPDEYVTSYGSHLHVHDFTFQEWCIGALHKEVLPKCGVPFDSYELSDIADPHLPEYKVYVFPNAFTLSAGMREKIKERVRRPGRTAIWVFAPGYYGLGEGSADDVSELTGVKVEVRKSEAGRHYTKTVAAVGDSICEKDGWRSVFMSLPPDTASLREAFRAAGAHVWLESEDVLAVGRGYVMLHASSSGRKTVRLPECGDVREIFGGKPAVRGVAEISETMRRGETRVWRVETRAAEK